MALVPMVDLFITSQPLEDASIVMIDEVRVSVPACNSRVEDIEHAAYTCPARLNSTGTVPDGNVTRRV